MGTIRTLATATAALIAALLLTDPLVHAEPQPGAAPGTPLKLIPPPKRTPNVHRAEEVRKPQHVARRHTVTPRRLASGGIIDGHVMRGPNNIDLIARLPWWRTPDMQPIHYPDKDYVSQVLATADAWFETEIGPSAEPSDDVQVVAADEFNELDRAAAASEGQGLGPLSMAAVYMPDAPEQSWLQTILAMLGGALAAVSAARYLFV